MRLLRLKFYVETSRQTNEPWNGQVDVPAGFEPFFVQDVSHGDQYEDTFGPFPMLLWCREIED